MSSTELVRDGDFLFNEYVNPVQSGKLAVLTECRFMRKQHLSVLGGFDGLQLKEPRTMVEKWLCWLEVQPGEEGG